MVDERTRLKLQIADLVKRRPAHSVKPDYIRQLEELEERLEELEKEANDEGQQK
ncbi:MAG TPA: histidine kinase [Bacillota bacterium]|nr:histidine kinase [Bacillota bacterium]